MRSETSYDAAHCTTVYCAFLGDVADGGFGINKINCSARWRLTPSAHVWLTGVGTGLRPGPRFMRSWLQKKKKPFLAQLNVIWLIYKIC